jgi:hypothetical protein
VIPKCRGLLAPVLGAAACNRLIETVMALERVKNVREVGALLQRA